MKAEITFSNLWYNPSVRNWFFRTQSERTLQKLMERAAISEDDVCDLVESYAEIHNEDVDGIEEMFYSFGDNTVEDLAAEFGIELYKEEDEDDE